MRALLLFFCAILLSRAAESPDALRNAGHFKRLRALADARLQRNPNDAEALYLRAIADLAFGHPEQAQKEAERAVSLDGKVSDYHRVLSEAAGTIAEHAPVFKQIGLARNIKKEADRAVELDPKNTDALFILMVYYQEAPGIVGGDKAKAQSIAQEIAKIDPVQGYMAQVRLQNARKDPALLEQLYQKAAQAGPASFSAQAALGNLYVTQNKLDLAEKQAERLLALAPDRTGGYSLRAAVQARRSQWNEMEHTLSLGEKAISDNLSPYYQIARTLLVLNSELPRAGGYLRKYLSQEPEGNAPSAAAAHWSLGLVEEKMGRKSEAISELQTALKLNPSLSAAQKDLQRLKK